MISIPFSGSKKYSYLHSVKPIVEAGGYDTVFEVFGGSCVLAANLYNDGVVKRAVINDYDGLFDMYPEYLDYKDWIVEKCLHHGIKRRVNRYNPAIGRNQHYFIDDSGNMQWLKTALLSSEDKTYLQSLVKQVPTKYWRLLTIGSNFTHSAVGTHKVIRLSDFTYFGSYIFTDKQRAYLEVIEKLERVSQDYRDFLMSYKEEFNPRSILIVDPPYCEAYQGQYKDQFTEVQTIELLEALRGLNTDFIFFNHRMDKVKQWLKIAGLEAQKLEYTGNANSSANRERQDVMAYIRRSKC